MLRFCLAVVIGGCIGIDVSLRLEGGVRCLRLFERGGMKESYWKSLENGKRTRFESGRVTLLNINTLPIICFHFA